MEVEGSVAIVTGASSGIGEATAVELARRGAEVMAVARREERLARTVAACERAGGRASARAVDVSDRRACEELVADVEAARGRVDVVVNNAGISLRRNAANTTIDDVERILSVNFLGAVYVALSALPGMLDRGRGSIVNVSSVAGSIPNPRESAYAASKAALSMWAHTMAVDLRGTGVHVGVIAPGPIDTEIWDEAAGAVAYEGKRYPPDIVAVAVAEMVESDAVQTTVPRRYGIFGALYPLLGKPMRWGLRRFAAQADLDEEQRR